MDIKILCSDDWEAIYLDGECVDQAHKIHRDTIAKIIMANDVSSYMEYWLRDEDDDPYAGRFPKKWDELKGNYE